MSERLTLVCEQCDAIVGVPRARLMEQPRCPQCHRALFSGHPIELQAQSFDKHVRHAGVPLVVDFWAPWCGPCRAMAPHFERVAQRMEPNVRFAKLNSDTAPQISARFGIRGIPTLVLFRGGEEIARQSGAMDAATLQHWLEQALARNSHRDRE